MPAAKRKRNSFTKNKRPRKKRQIIETQDKSHSNNFKSVVSYRSGTGLPQKKFVKLKYADKIVHNGSILNQTDYRMNSLFDPNFTSLGHQPLGFDEWKALYNRYRVNSVKVEVTAVQQDNAENASDMVAIFPNINDVSVVQAARVMELENVAYTFVGNTSSGQSIQKLEMYIDIKKLMGLNELDEDYASLVTTNPVINPKFTVWVENLWGNATAINIMVEITYYAEFFEPKLLGQS